MQEPRPVWEQETLIPPRPPEVMTCPERGVCSSGNIIEDNIIAPSGSLMLVGKEGNVVCGTGCSGTVSADSDAVAGWAIANGEWILTNGSSAVPLTSDYTEDTAAAPNPTGPLGMTIRDDNLNDQVGSDGDYTALRTDKNGGLWVTCTNCTPEAAQTIVNGAPMPYTYSWDPMPWLQLILLLVILIKLVKGPSWRS